MGVVRLASKSIQDLLGRKFFYEHIVTVCVVVVVSVSKLHDGRELWGGLCQCERVRADL